MSDSDPGGATTGMNPLVGATGPEASPQISIAGQYIKDLSFENPNAPRSLVIQGGQPQIQVNVDVQARGAGENMYEVLLRITASAEHEQNSVFVVELVYGGVFTFHDIPKDNHELICLVECPRLLFPFARRIIADATRDGGFPPLLLEPIDFVDLFRRHRENSAANPEDAAKAAGTA